VPFAVVQVAKDQPEGYMRFRDEAVAFASRRPREESVDVSSEGLCTCCMENVDCNQAHGPVEALVHRQMDLGKFGI
jgi:hypothetical protein